MEHTLDNMSENASRAGRPTERHWTRHPFRLLQRIGNDVHHKVGYTLDPSAHCNFLGWGQFITTVANPYPKTQADSNGRTMPTKSHSFPTSEPQIVAGVLRGVVSQPPPSPFRPPSFVPRREGLNDIEDLTGMFWESMSMWPALFCGCRRCAHDTAIITDWQ